MRWMWIDRIIELVPETSMIAIKNVSLAEEQLHDHFAADKDLPPLPIFPASLIIEGMAQTSGILVGSVRQFREKVILAKILKAELACDVFPGHSLRYETRLQRVDDAGAATDGTVSLCCPNDRQWQEIGRIDLLFSHVDQNLSGLELPEHNFVFGDNLRIIMQGIGLTMPAGQ